jgi:hypothetical protein
MEQLTYLITCLVYLLASYKPALSYIEIRSGIYLGNLHLCTFSRDRYGFDTCSSGEGNRPFLLSTTEWGNGMGTGNGLIWLGVGAGGEHE